MVIFFDMDTKQIFNIEENTMVPALPAGTTEEKKEILKRDNLDFISIPYEMGMEIFNYNLCFNESGQFVGIAHK